MDLSGYRTDGILRLGVIVVAGIAALFGASRLLFRAKRKPHVQKAECAACRWRGEVSRYAGKCPRCGTPMGEQRARRRPGHGLDNRGGGGMKERGFFRTGGGEVYEYVYYTGTGEVTAFGPVDKFGGGEQQAFQPVEVGSPEEAQRVLRERLGDGTFEDDWV